MTTELFATRVEPDWQALVDCIRRVGTPKRVHHIELFLDREVQDEVARLFHLLDGLDPDSPSFEFDKQIRIQRFLGYDYVRCGLDGLEMPLNRAEVEDTAGLQREGGRRFMEEHKGPITNWEEFEAYPWPDPAKASTRSLEWYSEHLPEDMCLVASGGFAHFAEYLTWLMGYESLCYALYDQRDLLTAISERLIEMFRVALQRMLAVDRIKIVWGSDDMGFKSSTLISPDDLREYVLPGHMLMAQMSHEKDRPYLLHACGNLREIMPDLIDDVRIDALHSFEDTIVSVIDMKREYGDRIALLGGIDVDFLCRATEDQVRARVRDTLEACLSGGGYCLGSGNSVANYIPVRNYLAMVDEGRRFTP